MHAVFLNPIPIYDYPGVDLLYWVIMVILICAIITGTIGFILLYLSDRRQSFDEEQEKRIAEIVEEKLKEREQH